MTALPGNARPSAKRITRRFVARGNEATLRMRATRIGGETASLFILLKERQFVPDKIQYRNTAVAKATGPCQEGDTSA